MTSVNSLLILMMTRATSSTKKILAIDTAQDETVIAVNDQLVSWVSDRNQTNELLPKIDRLLAKLNMKPIQLDGVVVNLGPGSFTGLRVGVTVANGFGYGLGLPVVGIDQFELLAKFYPKADYFILPGGRGEVFGKRKKEAAKIIKLDSIAKQIRVGDTVCVGDYALIPTIHEGLKKAGTIHLVNWTKKERLALMMKMAKLPKNFSQVMPVYVRGASITKPKKA